jgi:hypothetical protein
MDKTMFNRVAAAAVLCLGAAHASADVVTDWNQKAGEWLVDSKTGTPPANRVMAIVQTAVHEAVKAAQAQPGTTPGVASVDAAVAAANRVTLARLLPSQEAAVTAHYQATITRLPDDAARAAGIAAGEQAAAAVLARRLDDGAGSPDRHRPLTTAGTYVPTAPVAATQWPRRLPWLLTSPSQFRPGPPPALASAQWARDYDEVKALGARASKTRTSEQTEIGRFWDFSLPPVYHAALRSVVAAHPKRSVEQNARLFALASQAMDDALISVFDAKNQYNFWRPVTAIRNGDQDGNDATTVDPGWVPLIDTPMHQEYPSAHSIIAGALGTVMQAEFGNKIDIATSSPTAQGATRRWSKVEDFMREVSESRVYAGIHYRSSIETGLAMGRKVGAQALSAARAIESAALPKSIVPPGEARLVERVAARGVQVYECKADASQPNGAQWVFVAPEAQLFDALGASRGTHYAGPHWEAADGSRIVGKVEARAEAPQAGSIPWLLLSTTSVGGQGRFAGVTRVQRVNTAGGLAPSRRCDASAVGQVDKVPYTADYLLLAS